VHSLLNGVHSDSFLTEQQQQQFEWHHQHARQHDNERHWTDCPEHDNRGSLLKRHNSEHWQHHIDGRVWWIRHNFEQRERHKRHKLTIIVLLLLLLFFLFRDLHLHKLQHLQLEACVQSVRFRILHHLAAGRTATVHLLHTDHTVLYVVRQEQLNYLLLVWKQQLFKYTDGMHFMYDWLRAERLTVHALLIVDRELRCMLALSRTQHPCAERHESDNHMPLLHRELHPEGGRNLHLSRFWSKHARVFHTRGACDHRRVDHVLRVMMMRMMDMDMGEGEKGITYPHLYD